MQALLLALSVASLSPLAMGAATTTMPDSAGTSSLSEAMTVTGDFDCGLMTYGRGLDCDNDDDGGEDLAVFILEDGASLSNCIIGADQLEGVHCDGSCTITNVWWEDVCEDALTIDGGDGTISGGGAFAASDKVIQHNAISSVSITDFYVEDFGKLYRSCGNCKENGGPRIVTIDGVIANGDGPLAGVNSNYNDVATISNTCGVDPDSMCEVYTGCDKAEGDCEASKDTEGFDGTYCVDGGSNSATC